MNGKGTEKINKIVLLFFMFLCIVGIYTISQSLQPSDQSYESAEYGCQMTAADVDTTSSLRNALVFQNERLSGLFSLNKTGKYTGNRLQLTFGKYLFGTIVFCIVLFSRGFFNIQYGFLAFFHTQQQGMFLSIQKKDGKKKVS